ncbi:MAG: PKD domain-containing protein [Cyclobacteriaceae bacterium]|nr:PKD domain-containing protein [Cyclobacteriaceae bacterium]
MTGNLKQISFKDQNFPSTSFEPQNVSYTAPGTYPIELTAFSANGNFDTFLDTVVIRDASAPTTSFNTSNACITTENTFTASSPDEGQITAWNWDFGDGNTASGQDIAHQFLSTGTYDVQLSIDAANGCSNTTQKSISIHQPPVAGFSYDAGIVCSNSPMDFLNSTFFAGPDSLLSFQWNINDEALLADPDISYTFASGGDKNIALSASIPGCSSNISKTVNITPGPLTAFDFSGVCAYDEFDFSNLTSGNDITAYQWDFGDGYFSTLASPSHQFATGGSYAVGLTAFNALGCQTKLQKVVQVGHIPQLNFTHDLACADNSVTFFDQSLVAEANITEQLWRLQQPDLGYDRSAQGSAPNLYLDGVGQYMMTLIGQSNYGCADTLVRNIVVNPSPIAGISIEETCFGDSTFFAPAVDLPSGTELAAIDWLIDGQAFSSSTLKYKFAQPGSYEAQLFVRASNLCPSSARETIVINPLPAVDFDLSSQCEDQLVTITSRINSPQDLPASYLWSIDDKPVSTLPAFQYDFNKSGAYQVALSVTTANSCVSTNSLSIPIYPSPVSKFDVYPSIGASPLKVQFTDRSQGAKNWRYDFSRFSDDFSTDRNSEYTYQNIGEELATLIVTNEYGCADTSSRMISVVVPTYDIAISNARANEKDGKLKFAMEIENKGTIIINNPVINIAIGGQAKISQKIETTLMPGEVLEFVTDVEVLRIGNQSIAFVCFSIADQIGVYPDLHTYDNQACVNIDNVFTVLDPFPNPSRTFVDIPVIVPAPAFATSRWSVNMAMWFLPINSTT